MEATLDELGRIALPKEVRDDLGLARGAVLTIEEKGGEIRLKPASRRTGLIRKEGVLVFSGEVEGDLSEVVERDREERLRKAAGLGFTSR